VEQGTTPEEILDVPGSSHPHVRGYCCSPATVKHEAAIRLWQKESVRLVATAHVRPAARLLGGPHALGLTTNTDTERVLGSSVSVRPWHGRMRCVSRHAMASRPHAARLVGSPSARSPCRGCGCFRRGDP
jgi:hypothetical protein